MTWFFNNGARLREETLSTYIDGHLAPGERAKVQRLLDASPEWRQDLALLQAAIARVRAAPRVQARRSFALTPEMAGPHRAAPRQPTAFLRLAMSLATAAAWVVLAVSLAGGAGLFGATPQAVTTTGGAAADQFSGPTASPPAAGGSAPAGAPAPQTQLKSAESAPDSAETPTPPTGFLYGAGERTASQGPPAAEGPMEIARKPGHSPWPALAIASGIAAPLFSSTTFWMFRRSRRMP